MGLKNQLIENVEGNSNRETQFQRRRPLKSSNKDVTFEAHDHLSVNMNQTKFHSYMREKKTLSNRVESNWSKTLIKQNRFLIHAKRQDDRSVELNSCRTVFAVCVPGQGRRASCMNPRPSRTGSTEWHTKGAGKSHIVYYRLPAGKSEW